MALNEASVLDFFTPLWRLLVWALMAFVQTGAGS